MTFDPKRHLMKVQGRAYLPVSARLVWFRSEHPDWGIVTAPVEINMEKQYAIFSASIFSAEGKLMATATKMENVKGFPDYLEKAETGAVGRALAYCGYGTQFAPELEEGGRFADAPQGGNRFASGGNRPGGGIPPAGGGMNGGGGMNNGGGYSNRAMPPRPVAAPADNIDNTYEDEAPPAPRPVAAPRPPAPAPAPPAATNGNVGGITRVREPERPDIDPAGPGEDDEDPFADEDAPVSAPAARVAPPVRAATPPADAPANGDAPAPRPNPLGGNKCSVDGCPNVLSAGQMTMSEKKFGRAICLIHQKEATPLAGGANGAGRAPAGALL